LIKVLTLNINQKLERVIYPFEKISFMFAVSGRNTKQRGAADAWNILEKLVLARVDTNSPPDVKLEGTLPCKLEPFAGLLPESAESHPHTLFR
jgi:hypothetical protein